MPNPQKAKGNSYENDCCKVMQEAGLDAARIKAGWSDDRGDLEVAEYPQFVWQCKNYKEVSTALREGVDGAQVQKEVAGAEFGVAIIKRRLKLAEESYAVLPLTEFLRLIEPWKREEIPAPTPRPVETPPESPTVSVLDAIINETMNT